MGNYYPKTHEITIKRSEMSCDNLGPGQVPPEQALPQEGHSTLNPIGRATLVGTLVVTLVALPGWARGDESGSIVGWGRQVVGVDLSSGFAAVSAGWQHSLGLKTDSSIVAWGGNDSGNCNVPDPNLGFVVIAAGHDHSLGLKADGTIVAWGYNYDGQCEVPEPNTGFVAVAAGYDHSLGLKADGSIVAWGRNYYGQCDVPLPNADFIGIAAGYSYSLGLQADGSIVAWGDDGFGQCDVPEPNSGFVAIAAGWAHSLGLTEDGSIVAWGYNYDGQCEVPEPNQGFDTIATGGYFCLGLKENGAIVAWGDNSYGQCDVAQPNTDFAAVAAGYEHGLGLKTDGSVVVWGNNYYGQCNIPEPNSGFVAIATATVHDLGLKASGSIVAWGNDGDCGQCSVPDPNSGFVAIGAGQGLSAGLKEDGSIVAWGCGVNWDPPDPNTGFTRIAVGQSHILGLKIDGSIVARGDNSRGQCDVPEPNSGFAAVAGGCRHSLGLKENGSVAAWGDNFYHQCNVPSPNTGFVAVAAGCNHSLGLKADGSIVAWGSNTSGQCNVPSPNTGFVAIAAGWAHSLGLKADGSIVAWGDNWSGQCNVPEPNSGFVAIAAGGDQSLGIKGSTVIDPPSLLADGCGVLQSNLGVNPDGELTVYYVLFNPNGWTIRVGLGCSIRRHGTATWSSDLSCDTYVWVPPGFSGYERCFNVSISTLEEYGSYDVAWGLWETMGVGEPWDLVEKPNEFTVVSAPRELAVPYYNQYQTTWCWATSLSMLLRYYGYNDKPWEIAAYFNHGPDSWWIEPQAVALEMYLEEFYDGGVSDAWQLDFYINDATPLVERLRQCLSLGHPVWLASREANHAVVVAGYDGMDWDNDHVYVNDPSGALLGGCVCTPSTGACDCLRHKFTWASFVDAITTQWFVFTDPVAAIYAHTPNLSQPENTSKATIQPARMGYLDLPHLAHIVFNNSVGGTPRNLFLQWNGVEPYAGYRYKPDANGEGWYPPDVDGLYDNYDFHATCADTLYIRASYGNHARPDQYMIVKTRAEICDPSTGATVIALESEPDVIPPASFMGTPEALPLAQPLYVLPEGVYQLVMFVEDNQTGQLYDFVAFCFGVYGYSPPSVSGQAILVSDYSPLGGVLVQANNGGGSDVTDINGDYTLLVPYNWSGQVTASKDCHTFTPAYRDYLNLTTNQTGQDYVGTFMYFTLWGYVTTPEGTGISNVTVSVNGGAAADVTDLDGRYDILVPCGWSGTLTASKTGYDFSPPDYTFSDVRTSTGPSDFIGTVQTGNLQVTLSPPEVVSAGAQWRVDGGSWQESGATVTDLPVGTHTVGYKPVLGWNAPPDEQVPVNNGQTTQVTRSYTQQVGSLQVMLGPPGAVSAGAQWRVDSGGWQESGATVTGLPVGTHTVDYKVVAGWYAPPSEEVMISDGQLTQITPAYTPQGAPTGNLQVTLTPPLAPDAGARWCVDGGGWQNSGAMVMDLTVGTHTVDYKPIAGWSAPPSEQAMVSEGQTTSLTRGYVSNLPSDFDGDGDVDLTDFASFAQCFNGPNRPPVYPSCGFVDLDNDSDVDLSDFAIFAACFNGPNRPPTCP